MLTRNSLKALGIESEKIDAIIDGHVETVNGLKYDLGIGVVNFQTT